MNRKGRWGEKESKEGVKRRKSDTTKEACGGSRDGGGREAGGAPLLLPSTGCSAFDVHC